VFLVAVVAFGGLMEMKDWRKISPHFPIRPQGKGKREKGKGQGVRARMHPNRAQVCPKTTKPGADLGEDDNERKSLRKKKRDG